MPSRHHGVVRLSGSVQEVAPARQGHATQRLGAGHVNDLRVRFAPQFLRVQQIGRRLAPQAGEDGGQALLLGRRHRPLLLLDGPTVLLGRLLVA